ncbi:hypothetical protein MTO96_004728 [Rhipicephalus appendiculatus]
MYEGKTFKAYIGMSPTVVLHTPEAAEVLLSSKENTGKPNSYDFLKSWLGPKNLLTSKGDPWREKAKLLKNLFTSDHLENCMAVFNESGQVLEKCIETMAAESPDEPIDCYKNIQNCVLDIIGRASFGMRLGLQNGNRQEYARWFNYLTHLITVRYFRPWLWIQPIYDATYEGKFWKRTVDNIGKLHRSVLEKRKSAIMKKLVDESYDYELDDELSFPAALDDAIKKHISSPSSYTMDELEKDTTSVTFAESLRLCPPFPLIGRQLDEELVIDGYTLPAGTTCMINIHSLHRNKESFPDPDSYIP